MLYVKKQTRPDKNFPDHLIEILLCYKYFTDYDTKIDGY